MKFVDAIAEKNLRSTAVMTAARGRGKSAALGLSMASAVAFGLDGVNNLLVCNVLIVSLLKFCFVYL